MQIADAPNPHTPSPILERDKFGQLPENDDESVLVGCRKEKGVTKFYDRTAGVLALVRPSGGNCEHNRNVHLRVTDSGVPLPCDDIWSW